MHTYIHTYKQTIIIVVTIIIITHDRRRPAPRPVKYSIVIIRCGYVLVVLVSSTYVIPIYFFFANFAVDGEHSLVKTNVYYTRLAEPIGKL